MSQCTSSQVTTHSGDKLPCVTSDRLLPLVGQAAFIGADVIAVDEAQFFPDLVSNCIIVLTWMLNSRQCIGYIQVDFVTTAAEISHKTVIVAGLDGDFRRKKFGQLLDVVPLADSVIKVTGKCHLCSRKSIFSFRISADDRQEVVGGGDKYIPTCRYHYIDLSSSHAQHA